MIQTLNQAAINQFLLSVFFSGENSRKKIRVIDKWVLEKRNLTNKPYVYVQSKDTYYEVVKAWEEKRKRTDKLIDKFKKVMVIPEDSALVEVLKSLPEYDRVIVNGKLVLVLKEDTLLRPKVT